MKWAWRQLLRIRTRLLLVNALIVAVPLLGLVFARFYEGEMLRAVESDMIHQSQVVAELAGPQVAINDGVLRRAAHQTTTRLRIVDSTGRIAADSAGVRDLFVGERREIKRALKGHYGAATRVIEGRGVSVMFTAIPIIRDRSVVGAVYASRSTTSVQIAMRRLRRSILKILYIALLVTVILTMFFAATISRPLQTLATRARRLAAGDRTVKLALNRGDEIGELARALDEMATRLSGQSAEVAELAANISHELKSPLTSMRGAAELLLDGAADDPCNRDRFLRNILCDVDRLDRLVSRILELSRARADGEAFSVVDLCDIVEGAIAGTGERVLLVMPGARVAVNARPTHLGAALRNLAENALAHGFSDMPVRVELSVTATNAIVSIENRGPPIPVRARAKIFDRFYTTRSEAGGTGLGLPIACAVAAAHGGRVALEQSDTRATVFSIAIPLAESSLC